MVKLREGKRGNTKRLEELLKMVRGDVGVQVENDEGALVVSVGEGVGGGGEDVVGPDGLAGDESRRRRRRERVVEEGGVVMHVVGANGGERRLCLPEVVEVDGGDSVTESLHLDGSDVAENLEVSSEG